MWMPSAPGGERRGGGKTTFPNLLVATASWKFHFLCTHTPRSGACALGVMFSSQMKADAINCN